MQTVPGPTSAPIGMNRLETDAHMITEAQDEEENQQYPQQTARPLAPSKDDDESGSHEFSDTENDDNH